jgi:hypothetical protein
MIIKCTQVEFLVALVNALICCTLYQTCIGIWRIRVYYILSCYNLYVHVGSQCSLLLHSFKSLLYGLLK